MFYDRIFFKEISFEYSFIFYHLPIFEQLRNINNGAKELRWYLLFW